jgi:hypothetical protein
MAVLKNQMHFRRVGNLRASSQKIMHELKMLDRCINEAISFVAVLTRAGLPLSTRIWR